MSANGLDLTAERRPAAPPAVAATGDALRRLERLFRAAPASPLWPLLCRHRLGAAGAAQPAAAHASAAGAAVTRRAPIDTTTIGPRVARLPALPQAVMDVLSALREPSIAVGALAERLGRDQALTARTLRLANSAFYGVPGRVATLDDAISVLGFRTVGTLVAASAVTELFDPPACEGFAFAGFWRHAMATAMSARALARPAGASEGCAFTAGLLHDIGRLVLATQWPGPYALALAEQRRCGGPALAVEQAVLGIDHAELGARVAAHWHLPPAIVEAIALHHRPSQPVAPGGAATLPELVHVADALVHALDIEGEPLDIVPAIDPGAWRRVGTAVTAAPELLAQVEAGVAGACAAIGL